MTSVVGRSPRIRADRLLVDRGLVATREKARRLILGGRVRSGDVLVGKASDGLPVDAPLQVEEASPYVSRGGVKLEGALTDLRFDVRGLTAVDVGASTGGFTDCLLRAGAVRVHALDVGYGQLDWRLRQDPRVVVFERENVRHFDPERLGGPVDVATIDVSFISLRLVLPKVVRFVCPGGRILALVKPQFEVGKGQVGKGGVVRDPARHAQVLDRVREAARTLELEGLGSAESRLLGPKGNREFFLAWRTPVVVREEAG